ncbi:MAG: YggS family pyridoxal phosphate-dependent enzyme [Thermoanaerobaculia bacterium]
MPPPADIAHRYLQITRRIEEACQRSGRHPRDVVLVGASKTQPAAVLAEAWRAGLRVFGENRVQEALAKSRELAGIAGIAESDIDWHLIGPLQSNKVKPALDLFRTVHSIDRPRIAEALDREAGRRNLRISGLLEVNLGNEESKHGFSPEGLAEAARPLADLEHLKIVGLMAIPPQADDPEGSRPWFRRLRELRDELGARPEWAGFPGWLSMGMSHDFEVAVRYGRGSTTWVRVGTAIFGERA